jgi:UDPglucose 6-dehydrogenase
VHRIGVVGAGYVGLTTAACLAHLGNRVVCADVDEAKVEELNRGRVPVHERDLPDLVAEGLRSGRLRFAVGNGEAVAGAEVVFLCVPTPTGADGAADVSAVDAVLDEVRPLLAPDCVVVVKSTVPVGTTERLRSTVDQPVVANPEFLREGHAVWDFLHPSRVVVGADDEAAGRRVAALYESSHAPVLVTDSTSAELVKYASNCFLAMKLSYVNTLAELCERLGADIDAVTDGMGLDDRIGRSFLAPGPGWGGSCLPKDTRALLATATGADVDFPLLRATISTNERQAERVVSAVRDAAGGSLAGTRIGLLGLTFKAGTDDLRDSPALTIAERLAAEGADLTGYDPCVRTEDPRTAPVSVVDSPYLAAKDVSVLVLLTEWPEFTELDWVRLGDEMRERAVVDTRNLLGHVPTDGFHVRALGHAAR